MNAKSLLILLTSASALACPTAHAESSRLYFMADVGAALTPDTELKHFFGPVGSGSEVDFDPGIRFGFAGGYRLTDWFSAEAETGLIANNIDSITGASEVDASLSNVPLLINARLQCPKTTRLTPYIGGGLGMSGSIINADRIVIGGTKMDGSDVTVVFAYQAFGGLRYKLNEQVGLSVEYRYFATTGPEWKADRASGVSSDKLRFGGIQTHTLSVGVDFKF